MSKLRIKAKRPWIAYPGSTVQQNYAEAAVHGYLLWDIENRDKFDVKFHQLPNPRPFITIEWQDGVASTVEHAKQLHPPGARFRVYSHEKLSQKDVVEITQALHDELQAVEVTFKTDQQISRDIIISSGSTQVIKEDLHGPDVLLRLLREYHRDATVSEETWAGVHDLVSGYLSQLGARGVVRNTKWTLRHLKFDNTFGYGEGNVVNFDNMNGIVGIFGPNRSGKSSLVGTVMYALFNATDRGSIKNLHVINARKPYCYTRAILNINGSDYVIERQTVKNETRRGQVNASTALNLFKMEDGEVIDLAGEQRNDTEKEVRKLIGSADDFLLTSLSAQDEIKMFISQGSTRRRQILSRFLDLDIFDQMYDLAKNDLNATKAVLKSVPNRDWMALDAECYAKIEEYSDKIGEHDVRLAEIRSELEGLRGALTAHHDFTPVTRTDVDAQRNRVNSLEAKAKELRDERDEVDAALVKLTDKIDKITVLQREHNLIDLRRRLEALRSLESSVQSLRHAHEREASSLRQQQRSLKILDEVPCGDQFPSCKFIKNAHALKDKVEPQRSRVDHAQERLTKAEDALGVLKQEDLPGKVQKIEQLQEMSSRLQVQASQRRYELLNLDTNLKEVEDDLTPARDRLSQLEEALKNEENAEVVALRTQIDRLQHELTELDNEKMTLASERGRVQSVLDKHATERARREEVLRQMRVYELITHAFSRRGIPSVIIRSQLPIINAEIAKILQGIVDFTIELESDDDSDSSEVYINYGDSRRIIELGSGMEKMIASVAIRVALVNVSSLPKTDTFIIDESFGSLDDQGVEACNRLLVSLKRYFRTILVITHVEGVKDTADLVVEVTKNEKDAKVTYE